ncbi:MAG: hypothetical protein COS85_11285 [Armatimonadetes bacterium CG07_land_8_20_14_0_80_59_28]|nr:MAG: hypothetical protein COS85_11285 [Armatimonadetes bacterium CG07_land_8_20_14_0_80_59_28]
MKRRSLLIVVATAVASFGMAHDFLVPVEAHRITGLDGKPVPHWVRYPFEYQLCGISLGDKLLDRGVGNYIFRYALVRVHGMPDGIVVGRSATAAQLPPEGGAGEAGGAGGPGGGPAVFRELPGGPEGGPSLGAAPSGAGAAGVAGAGAAGAEVSAAPAPAWATAAWVVLDGNHVEWLYRRDTYVMGFMVDRLGFVDGIVVAGSECPIARTQLADPAHHIKLGDDSRKVMYRYGFPDEIETFVSSGGGAPAGGEGIQIPGSATVTFRSVTNELRRSYLFKYHDSYNVIFTIQDNKVVRINIWGDPDYFTPDRKLQIKQEKY